MNEGRDTTADDTTGAALAEVLRAAPDEPVTPPPVADIADRAAEWARARAVRRRAASVAASVILVAGGLVVWNSVGDGSNEPGSIRTEDLVEGVETGGDASPGSSQSAPDVDPAEVSTGPVIEWQEVEGPNDGFGTLSTLADGRVLLQIHADGTSSAVFKTSAAFVTVDGRTWDPVPLPRGVEARVIALDGDRWIVAGQLAASSDPLDTLRVSDDQGESWQPLDIPGLTDTDGNITSESVVTNVVRFGDSLAVASLPLSVGDENFTVTVAGPEGVRAARDFSSAFVWPQLTQVEGTLVVMELALLPAGPESDVVSDIEETVWTTADGETWVEAADPSDDFLVRGAADGVVFGTGFQDGVGVSVRRLTGAGTEEVVNFPTLTGFAPQEVSSNGLSVGPSGLATILQLGGVEPSAEDDVLAAGGLPVGVVASKDGIELIFDADGSSALVDTRTGEVLRQFPRQQVGGGGAPGTVNGTPEDDFVVRFEDPETGEELVTFREEDIVAQPPTTEPGADATAVSVPTPVDDGGGSLGDTETPMYWIAWSADGESWGFESVADAFGLSEGAGVAPRHVAVGDGFVVAAASQVPPQSDGDPSSGSLDRWFIAEVE